MNQKRNLFFFVCMVFFHLLWFIGATGWGHIYNGDSQEYFFLADNLRQGLYYANDARYGVDPFYISLRTPLYAVFIGVVHSIFGKQDWIILLLQNVISICTCFFTLKIFNRFYEKKYEWIYWLLIIAYPAQMLFANMIVPDFLLQLFMTLYVYHLMEMRNNRRWRLLWLMSAWLMLAFLAKPVVYPFFLLHLLLILVILWKNNKLQWLPVAALPIVMVFSYGMFMKSKTGFYHLSSVQAHNLLDFNLKAYHEFKYGFAAADSMNKAAHAVSALEADFRSKYKKEEHIAKDSIKANLVSYSIYHIYRSARYFLEPGKGEIDLFTGHNTYKNIFSGQSESFYTQYEKHGVKGAWNYIRSYPWLPLIVLIVFFNIVRIAGFVMFLFSKSIPFYFRLFIAVFITYFAVLTGPVSNYTRYFLPVLCIMSAASMIGFAEWWQCRHGKKNIA